MFGIVVVLTIPFYLCHSTNRARVAVTLPAGCAAPGMIHFLYYCLLLTRAFPLASPAGLYYLRTRAAADAIKFTVDQQALKSRKSASIGPAAGAAPASKPTAPSLDKEAQMAAMLCSLENKEACLMCGS